MKRIPFLPAFFVVLSAGLLVAIAFRVHSYQENDLRTVSAERAITPEKQQRPPASQNVDRELTLSSPSQSETPPLEERPSRAVPDMPPVSESVPQDPIQRVVHSVWFDPANIQTGESEALHLRAGPNARVEAINGVLQNASRSARLPFTCAAGTDSIWNCRLTVPSCVACGRWRIEQLKITGGERVVEVPSSHPLILGAMIHLSGERCDAAPPFLHAITIDDSDDGGDNIVLMLTVADGYCGVAGINGTAVSSRGQRLPFSGIPAGDENTWSARVKVSSSTDRGSWRVSSIEVTDTAGNFKLYSEADPVLKDAVFAVQ